MPQKNTSNTPALAGSATSSPDLQEASTDMSASEGRVVRPTVFVQKPTGEQHHALAGGAPGVGSECDPLDPRRAAEPPGKAEPVSAASTVDASPTTSKRLRKRNRKITSALGHKLLATADSFQSTTREAAALRHHAYRLLRCAAEDGWNCGSALCPACSAAKAKKHRNELVRLMRDTGLTEANAVFLTFTVATDTSLSAGCAALTVAMGRLRRLKIWNQAIRGGFYFVQIEPVFTLAMPSGWNTHAHGLFQQVAPGALDVEALSLEWPALLTSIDARLVGRVHNEPVYDLWAWRVWP